MDAGASSSRWPSASCPGGPGPSLAWSFAGRPLWEPGWVPSRASPPATIDWALVTAFAAYSGAGGTINAMLTYWLRDKGFGMAGTVGAQPTPVGDQTILLPRDGAIFPPSEANLAKWREWWRYLRADLSYLWTAGLPDRHGAAGAARARRGAAGHGHGRLRGGRDLRARADPALLGPALAARAADHALDLLLDPGRHRGGLRAQRDRDAVDGGRATGQRGRGLGLLPGARALRGGGVPRHDGGRSRSP